MTPTELRARIAADYAVVRPLPSPAVRALAVTPFAMLALLAAPAYFSVRADAPALGLLLTWGASLIQVAIGFALIAAALRESVPGRSWTPVQLVMWVAASLLVVIAVTFATASVSALPLAGGWWIVGAVCLGGSAAMALPIVALASVLAMRAYPIRPVIAGLLAGLGAGLMADAGWRIFCHYGEPAHVLSAHLGGVVLAAAAGATLAITLRKPFQ